MIIIDRENVNGNTVLSPEFDNLENEQYERLKKEKREQKNKLRQKRILKKLKSMQAIIVFFSIGMILVSRYAVICNLKRDVASIQQQINEVKKSNEDKKIQLLKYDNLNYVEKVAKEKLNMIEPNSASAFYCDVDKVNLKKQRNYDKVQEKNGLSSFFNFIKEKLF